MQTSMSLCYTHCTTMIQFIYSHTKLNDKKYNDYFACIITHREKDVDNNVNQKIIQTTHY